MTRYHIVKDGIINASTATREAAIDLIRLYQSKETHQILKANFSIIAGEEEFIPYEGGQKMKTRSYELFKKYAVEAGSLEDFLERYTKPSRHLERGAEYVKVRIASHQEDIDKEGFTFITRHDSKSGETVSYYPHD